MENKVKEIWKTIPNFEKDTEVSNLGNVRRIDSKTGEYIKRSIHKDKDGYLHVCLKKLSNNRYTHQGIHRLVAMAFIPNPDNKPCVNHIDSDKSNNLYEIDFLFL